MRGTDSTYQMGQPLQSIISRTDENPKLIDQLPRKERMTKTKSKSPNPNPSPKIKVKPRSKEGRVGTYLHSNDEVLGEDMACGQGRCWRAVALPRGVCGSLPWHRRGAEREGEGEGDSQSRPSGTVLRAMGKETDERGKDRPVIWHPSRPACHVRRVRWRAT
jgi:hypothetical protein